MLVARIDFVSESQLVNRNACGETPLVPRPPYVMRVRIPDTVCPDWWTPYVIAHEMGHVVCWTAARDSGEPCADAYAAQRGYYTQR